MDAPSFQTMGYWFYFQTIVALRKQAEVEWYQAVTCVTTAALSEEYKWRVLYEEQTRCRRYENLSCVPVCIALAPWTD